MNELTLNRLHNMSSKPTPRDVNGRAFFLTLQMADDLKIGQCPCMPGLVPIGIIMGCQKVRMQYVCDITLNSR